MKGGQLSNKLAPGVGIFFEQVVYNFGKLNEPGKAFLEHLISIDCNIYLFTLLSHRKVAAWCFKWAVPYTGIIEADSILELPQLSQAHHLSVFFATDDRLLEAVRSRGNPQIEAKKWEQNEQYS